MCFGLCLFVLIFLIFNLLVFVLLIGFVMQQFSYWVDLLMFSLFDWLSFLQYIVWLLFVLLVLVIVFFIFIMVVNIIFVLFNGFFLEKVEVVVCGCDDFLLFSWVELLVMILCIMGCEMCKFVYFLLCVLVLLVLSFVFGVNLIVMLLWIFFGIWMMVVQYIDYLVDNYKFGWNEMFVWLCSKCWVCMGFGGVIYLVLLILLVNLVMMFVVVVGVILFWVCEEGEKVLVK